MIVLDKFDIRSARLVMGRHGNQALSFAADRAVLMHQVGNRARGGLRPAGCAPLAERSLTTEYAHTLGNFMNRQTGMAMIRHHGRARHIRHGRFFGVLNKSSSAVLRNCPQPSGPVTEATTQNNAYDPLPIGFGGGDEKRIGCGACVVNLRPLG